jgi:hypothetical protein
MNILQIDPDGSKQMRAIPPDWGRSFRVPILRPMRALFSPDAPDRIDHEVREYARKGTLLNGMPVYVTNAHDVRVAEVKWICPPSQTDKEVASIVADVKLRNFIGDNTATILDDSADVLLSVEQDTQLAHFKRTLVLLVKETTP